MKNANENARKNSESFYFFNTNKRSPNTTTLDFTVEFSLQTIRTWLLNIIEAKSSVANVIRRLDAIGVKN